MTEPENFVDLGPAVLSWGGFEVLDTQAHCQISRRVHDDVLFAEIWIPQMPACDEEPVTWAYVGPIRLPT